MSATKFINTCFALADLHVALLERIAAMRLPQEFVLCLLSQKQINLFVALMDSVLQAHVWYSPNNDAVDKPGHIDGKAPQQLEKYYSNIGAVSPLECYATARPIEKESDDATMTLLQPLEHVRSVNFNGHDGVDVRVLQHFRLES